MAHVLPTIQHTDPAGLNKKDFTSDQEVRWCPGCGDYSILAQVQRTLPTLGIPRENFVVVSGIGCSSRFPYYVDTYGIHSIHGRAPAFATGIKSARPELSVWMITGDGDGLSIGANHLMHILRRNVDVKILLFNNKIYGLTKGQYSPTSEPGKRTGSSPVGSIDYPVEPVKFALGSSATFVARVVDVDAKHFQTVIGEAAAHRGASFVEILQNCPIYNDGAWEQLADKKTRPQHALYLKAGERMTFGPDGELGLAVDEHNLPVAVGAGDPKVMIHDPENESQALILSRLSGTELPTPLGVLYRIERATYDGEINAQLEAQRTAKGGTLQQLLERGETWRVG
jgi:2-oxoglutarate ferredoxin oxidoreductase subunit beta